VHALWAAARVRLRPDGLGRSARRTAHSARRAAHAARRAAHAARRGAHAVRDAGSAWPTAENVTEGTARPTNDLASTVDAPATSDSPAPGHSPAADDTAPPFSDWRPYGGDQAQVPAAPVPLWRRFPIGLVVFLVLVVGGGISSWYFGAGRADTGEIAKPGDLTATDLRVGDCFDLKDPTAEEIEDVAARPCAQAHEFELFFTGSLPEGAYPPQSVFDAYMQDNCMPAFLAFVGKAYEDSELDVYWLTPTTEAWGQGDRSVQCVVSHPRIHQLTESLKGSRR
jgi:hypothetical protein